MVAPNPAGLDNAYPNYVALEAQDAIESLRSLKNELIGHADRKRQAIQAGLVSNLANVLKTNSAPDELRTQAAIVLASLCQPDILHTLRTQERISLRSWQVEEQQIMESLLLGISSPSSSPALLSHCLRALNALVLAGADATLMWSLQTGTLTAIVQAAASSTVKPIIVQQATYAASLFATITIDTPMNHYEAEIVLSALIGITINVTQLGQRTIEAPAPLAKLLDATLSALAAMTKIHRPFATNLALAGRLSQFKCASDEYPMISTLLKLVRNRSNITRLGSSSCLTNMYRNGAIPRSFFKQIALCVLPILVRLLEEPALRSQASSVLTNLVKDSDEMQKAACEAGAIQKLSAILQSPSEASDESNIESALTALAAITLHKDEYRKQVVDAKVVPLIVASMSHSSPRIRTAACQCARSLSRSVAMLRTSLIDAGVAKSVFELMSDPDINVKTAATAAVCNLVLDFSPIRRIILESGVLKLLGKLSQDENQELRLNAVWAIKHIVYSADTDVKEAVLGELTAALLLKLCEDEENVIQEQACEVVRNLVCGKPENIDILVESVGVERLADLLVRKLQADSPEIVTSAMYSLVHIAAGSERHRMILMQRSIILEHLRRHLCSDVEEIKLGAVWTIINLTWQEDEASAAERAARVATLTSMQFKEALLQIENDHSLDVRERVKTALAQLHV